MEALRHTPGRFLFMSRLGYGKKGYAKRRVFGLAMLQPVMATLSTVNRPATDGGYDKFESAARGYANVSVCIRRQPAMATMITGFGRRSEPGRSQQWL